MQIASNPIPSANAAASTSAGTTNSQTSAESGSGSARGTQSSGTTVTTSASATTVDEPRLRMVDMLSRIMVRIDAIKELDPALKQNLLMLLREQLVLASQDGAQIADDAWSTWLSRLDKLLSGNDSAQSLDKLLRSMASEQSLPSGGQATVELLSRLAGNDFSGLSLVLGAFGDALATENVATWPDTAKRMLPTLLAALRQLEVLGLPDSSVTALPPTSPDQGQSSLVSKIAQNLAPQVAWQPDASQMARLASAYGISPPAEGGSVGFTAQVVRTGPEGVVLDKGLLPASSAGPAVPLLRDGAVVDFTWEKQGGKDLVIAWPASTNLPAEERDYWRSTGLPPQVALEVRNVLPAGELPADPSMAAAVGRELHRLSLEMPGGSEIPASQKDLLLRTVLLAKGAELPQGLLQGLARYQPGGERESALVSSLGDETRQRLLASLAENGKVHSPETMQAAVARLLGSETHALSSGDRQVLQQLHEQLQWSRLDQDSRHPADREQAFYFLNGEQLHKGAIQVRDERGQGGKRQNSGKEGHAFTVETRLPHLGKVMVDMTLLGDRLDVRLSDEKGNAREAVTAERQSLSEELADMGLSLGELVYGAMRLAVADPRPAMDASSQGARLDLLG